MRGLSQRMCFTLKASFAAIVCLMALTVSGAQQSNTGASGSSLFVPGSVMTRYCTTMVSPYYPPGLHGESSPAVVTLRATIRKSGTVSPISIVSGPHELESAAMDAVRLWRYRPYMKDQEPLDVTTEIQVEFYPGRLGGVITHPAK
jgi:periplasmic protein TonB